LTNTDGAVTFYDSSMAKKGPNSISGTLVLHGVFVNN